MVSIDKTAVEGRTDQPLYELIYATLRQHIEGGHFPAGLVLGEAIVARAFQASRVPAAAALRRLREDGLIRDFEGRGFIVPDGGEPVRLELVDAGLRLPGRRTNARMAPNRRESIYPEVEHTVAACLAFGRFLLNESALAEHFGVSRTVAHEVLSRLDRTGLISQDTNRRWYAGPLTPELLREHYEMRWLLEPIALGQVFDDLTPDELRTRLRRLERAEGRRLRPQELEGLERDLHVDIVLRCRNGQLRETIRRSQLPILATHSTFERHQHTLELETMVAEHMDILRRILEGNRQGAMKALEGHLRRSLAPNIELMNNLKTGPGSLPAYLKPV
jgi:DNA-binding GntR family transcriptional regulator